MPSDAEWLGLVSDLVLRDCEVARGAIADLMETAGRDAEAACIREPMTDYMPWTCQHCGVVMSMESPRSIDFDYRSEDDLAGELLCQDWKCGECRRDMVTVVFRPACFHTYHGPELEFSGKKPLTGLPREKEG